MVSFEYYMFTVLMFEMLLLSTKTVVYLLVTCLLRHVFRFLLSFVYVENIHAFMCFPSALCSCISPWRHKWERSKGQQYWYFHYLNHVSVEQKQWYRQSGQVPAEHKQFHVHWPRSQYTLWLWIPISRKY